MAKIYICLPMETTDAVDVVYLSALLIANCLAFFLICACYARIYFSLDKDTRRGAKATRGAVGSSGNMSRGRGSSSRASGEMTVAKRMALLVFTDFACWAPIAFFGLTAVAGMPLIDVTRSKILLVFFYPLNSCANPYLYAILTKQYRRDLFILLSRYKLSGDPLAIGSGSGRRRGGSRSVAASFEEQRPSLGTIRNELPPPAVLESAVITQAPVTRVISLPLHENGVGQRQNVEEGFAIKIHSQEVYL
ncbi:hypothetical protein J437_LFUL015084 [Ladona fulva]|uniref:G-protein coupled receptors family 1 profile domain-containing protein n=1 Tax=Ladona fulva TaxID=123851 RepID=A0A8K0KWA2_LADFU|nr:hypothetical protein J437_LFUL015084 [Ladona fulva]